MGATRPDSQARRAGLPSAREEPWPRWFVKTRGKEIPLADAGERELIAALRSKDMAALEQLLQQFGGPMSTLARSMLRDPAEAQDVVEEALVRAHEAGPGFRGERGVRTWVLRITANLCRDRLRRRRFTAASLDGPVTPDDPALRFEPVAGWDEALDQRVLARRLDAAIARLPADQREVVVLRHQLGLSYEDMCGTLGVPLGTIKSRLARALATLREDLRDVTEEWER
jgi:RNA polymerase sigma-70 factor (ECF subfamily)